MPRTTSVLVSSGLAAFTLLTVACGGSSSTGTTPAGSGCSEGTSSSSSSSSGTPKTPSGQNPPSGPSDPGEGFPDGIGGESHPMANAPCASSSSSSSSSGSPSTSSSSSSGSPSTSSSSSSGGGQKAQMGDTCESDDLCASGKCIKFSNGSGSGSLCTKACSEGSDCPSGWSCSLVQFQACVPN